MENVFLRDEIREGFYVPTAIKQAWAADLVVLFEFDRVCREHGISYFGAYGTALGAVRHKGFVPWDDDIDVVMTRENYNRFRAICDEALPKEFTIQDYERKADYGEPFPKIVSASHITFTEEYLRAHYNFPYLASIDLYVADYIYRDDEKEENRDQEIKLLIGLAVSLREGTIQRDAVEKELQQLGEIYHMDFLDDESAYELSCKLFSLAERVMSQTKIEESRGIAQIYPRFTYGNRKAFPAEMFDETIRVPFEYGEISMPKDYDTMLQLYYGDNYMTPVKNGGAHNYPFFEKQKEALLQVEGFSMREFRYDVELEKKLLSLREEILEELNRNDSYQSRANRVVVFLPTGSEEWKILEPIYLREKEAGSETYVVPLVQLSKDPLGQINISEGEYGELLQKEGYPEDLEGWDATDFPMDTIFPDQIYTTNGYDGENPCLTVLPNYYTERLRALTKKLTYVQGLIPEDFTGENPREYHNMKYYVTIPGVMYADEILVPSEVLRQTTIQKLTEFTGAETRAIWDERVKVRENG